MFQSLLFNIFFKYITILNLFVLFKIDIFYLVAFGFVLFKFDIFELVAIS